MKLALAISFAALALPTMAMATTYNQETRMYDPADSGRVKMMPVTPPLAAGPAYASRCTEQTRIYDPADSGKTKMVTVCPAAPGGYAVATHGREPSSWRWIYDPSDSGKMKRVPVY